MFPGKVITGGVKSNIVKPNSIPDTSLYKSMENVYQAKRINISQSMNAFLPPRGRRDLTLISDNAMPTDKYARIVVAETMKAKPRRSLWAGPQSMGVWFLDTFLPRTVMVRIPPKLSSSVKKIECVCHIAGLGDGENVRFFRVFGPHP
jgi:1-acylglycerone phosphate reductase